MKKLFLLLLIALPMLVSCGDDDKDEPVYLDNALLEGQWYRIDLVDSIVLLFKDGYMVRIVYDKYWLNERTRAFYGEYKITDTKIITKGMTHFYLLEEDTLSTRAKNTEFVKHIRLKN